jgi:CDP-4-dehydro-6-deoxyglucose reductase, E1
MDDLREEINKKCREYFASQHALKPFIPGETYIPVAEQTNDAEDLENLISAALDLKLSHGRYTDEFEDEFSSRLGRRSTALLTNSGSSANLIAVSALGSDLMKTMKMRPIEKGDEIITAACGFPTTVNPIIQNGFIPVFIDVELETLNATFEMIQSARTAKTRAVMLSHTLGNPFPADKVAEWCRREGLYLIEDSCDALGGFINGQPVGSFGDYSTFSFYPAHHISMGEGGAVASGSGALRRVAASIRDWGRDCWCDPGKDNTCGKRFGHQLGGLPSGYDHKYTYSSIGYNLKATELQAAIGVSQLKKLTAFGIARRKNYTALHCGIKSYTILRSHLRPIDSTFDADPSWFGFPMHVQGIDRTKLLRYLEEHKVGTRLVFGGNLTKQSAYKHVDYRIHGELKNTDLIMENAFWIGVHPGLTPEKINYMLEVLEAGVKEQVG